MVLEWGSSSHEPYAKSGTYGITDSSLAARTGKAGMRWKFSVGMRKLEVSGFRDGRRGDNQQEAGMAVTGGRNKTAKAKSAPKKSGKSIKIPSQEAGWKDIMLSVLWHQVGRDHLKAFSNLNSSMILQNSITQSIA